MGNKEITLILYVVLMPVAFILFVWILAKFIKVVFPLLSKLEKIKKPEAFEKGETTQYVPKFVNKEVAVYIARSTSNLYFMLAVITGTASVIWSNPNTKLGLISAAILCVVGIGLRAMSRVAAVAGLVFYAGVKVLTFNILGITLLIVFLLFLINGIKATFAYHKFSSEETTQPGNTEEINETPAENSSEVH